MGGLRGEPMQLVAVFNSEREVGVFKQVTTIRKANFNLLCTRNAMDAGSRRMEKV